MTLTSSVTWTPLRIEAKRTAIPANGTISATAVALSELASGSSARYDAEKATSEIAATPRKARS